MDLANAMFEFGGAIFILNHIKVLLKEKMVRGVSIASVAFFSTWGFFNIFYYSYLEQPLSWLAGLLVMSANTVWLSLMIYYRRKEKLGM